MYDAFTYLEGGRPASTFSVTSVSSSEMLIDFFTAVTVPFGQALMPSLTWHNVYESVPGLVDLKLANAS